MHPIFFVCIRSFCLHRGRFWFFACIRSFLFASDLFCLHPIFFVSILSFLFASYLFCLHPIFFVCSKPFFIALTLVGHRTFKQKQASEKIKVLNFNDPEGWEKFSKLTEPSTILSDMWPDGHHTKISYQKWQNNFNRILHLCFKKKRIRSTQR